MEGIVRYGIDMNNIPIGEGSMWYYMNKYDVRAARTCLEFENQQNRWVEVLLAVGDGMLS